MADQAVATFGRLDLAFNNAGIRALPSDATGEPAETGGSGADAGWWLLALAIDIAIVCVVLAHPQQVT